MPRDGSGVYTKPAGTTAVANTVIESAKYNSVIDDIASDLNAARPIVAGGTGGTSVATAQTALSVDNKVVSVTKSANYTAIATDNNALMRFTANATLSLTAAATLGSGWHVTVYADGGQVIIDPNGAETINGGAALTLSENQSAYVICTGSEFFAVHFPALNAANAWPADQSFTGIEFGSTFAGGPQDMSDHIKLYSTTYGFCVTSGFLNYNVPAGSDHRFYVDTTVVARFNSGGLTLGTNGSITFAGTGAATTVTNLGFNGVVKAWVKFNGSGTPAIDASGNVSSITDNGVGDYTINFTSSLADANYALAGQARPTAGLMGAVSVKPATSPTASACNIVVYRLLSGSMAADDSTAVTAIFIR